MQRTLAAAAAVIASTIVMSVAVASADHGSVTGTVTAKGVRTSANIVLSLRAPGLTVTPPKKPIEMDQKGMVFLPFVLPVVTGTTVKFLNSDPLPHNVFSPEGKYNLGTWPQGDTREYTYKKPGVYTQLCRVHTEMVAYVVVLDTPYFATTNASGQFEIKDVPAGTYTLVGWGERLKKFEQSVTVEDGKATTVNITMAR
ncbi:MAG: carboxypeptidase regulatory-like domain-containing protein [Acidobacteria bacterium]|nr:carboxypeptidase regulatory-like domain-containing protein [Acidobacteriota bacterium]